MQTILVVLAFLAGFFTMAHGASPRFTRSVYSATVAENAAVGTSIATLLATDTDTDDKLTYSMRDSSLQIDSVTGVVSIKQLIDYERTTKITVTVTAEDLAADVANTILLVTITDVNDNSPVFLQEYSTTLEAVDGTVSSMTPLTIEAIDLDSGDNSIIKFSILSGNDGNYFAIDSTTGVLSFKGPFDASKTNFATIKIVLEAADQGTVQRRTTATVVLEIKNTETSKEQTINVCSKIKWMVQRNGGSDNKCYKLVMGRKPWQHAQDYCRWLGVKSGLEPGNLVTIEDSSKQEWIVDLLMSKRHSIWTGLNDQDTEGTMTWIDGTSYDPQDFNNWAILNSVQQPGGGAVKNCVAIEGTLRSRGAFLGKWNDFKCTMKTWSVCEFPTST